MAHPAAIAGAPPCPGPDLYECWERALRFPVREPHRSPGASVLLLERAAAQDLFPCSAHSPLASELDQPHGAFPSRESQTTSAWPHLPVSLREEPEFFGCPHPLRPWTSRTLAQNAARRSSRTEESARRPAAPARPRLPQRQATRTSAATPHCRALWR